MVVVHIIQFLTLPLTTSLGCHEGRRYLAAYVSCVSIRLIESGLDAIIVWV